MRALAYLFYVLAGQLDRLGDWCNRRSNNRVARQWSVRQFDNQ